MSACPTPTARTRSVRSAVLAPAAAGLLVIGTIIAWRALPGSAAPLALDDPTLLVEAPEAPELPGRIVYARTDGAVWNVYAADANGDDEVRLTGNADDPWQEHMRFTPDGAAVAYDVYPGDATYSLFVVPSTGGVPTPVAIDGNATDPAFNPADPEALTFALREGHDAEDPHDLMRRAPDGTLAPLIANPGVDERGPDYSVDGTRLAYERMLKGATWDIWVADADGSDAHALLQSAGHERLPRWSPDGRRLAFIDGAYAFGLGTLKILDLASGSVESLAQPVAGPLAWSPTGDKILFHNPRIDGATVVPGPGAQPLAEGQVGLHLIDVSTRTLYRLRGAAGGHDEETMFGGYGPDWWAPSPTPTVTPSPTATATPTRPPWVAGKVSRLPLVVRNFAHYPPTATATATITATATLVSPTP